jgi:hypothetical protein
VSTNEVGATLELALRGEGELENPPVAYQWSRNGRDLKDDDRVSGAQTPLLAIRECRLNEGGNYAVKITLLDGGETNATASVHVYTMPEIQSVSYSLLGDDLFFKVSATGGLLGYQWLWQGQPITGATNSQLVFSNAYVTANAGYYTVSAGNPAGVVYSPEPGTLFLKPAPSGTYQCLYSDPEQPAVASSGFAQLSLSAKSQRFTGKILSQGKSHGFSGVFSPAHEAVVVVARPNSSPLTLNLQLLTLNNSPQIQGTVTDGDWTAQLLGNRLSFSRQNPAPQTGNYTLALLMTEPHPSKPSGHGYGMARVRTDGSVLVSGQTADGTAFAQSCGLSAAGDCPFHAPLYKGRGLLAGWLNLPSQTNNTLIKGTAVSWLKPPIPGGSYPGGFAATLTPVGSKYALPTTSAPILRFGTAVLTFSGGDLLGEETAAWEFVRVQLRAPHSFIPEQSAAKVKFSVSKSNGSFTGSFVDFGTGLRAPFRGVVLQQQNYAAGFFLSTNSAGAVQLVPQ